MKTPRGFHLACRTCHASLLSGDCYAEPGQRCPRKNRTAYKVRITPPPKPKTNTTKKG